MMEKVLQAIFSEELLSFLETCEFVSLVLLACGAVVVEDAALSSLREFIHEYVKHLTKEYFLPYVLHL
jgi:hypothetical protein